MTYFYAQYRGNFFISLKLTQGQGLRRKICVGIFTSYLFVSVLWKRF